MKEIQQNKKLKTAAIVLLAIAIGIFSAGSAFSTTWNDNDAKLMEPREHCSEEFCLDEDLCENELEYDYQILVANKNPLVKWVCKNCGLKQQRAKSAGRPLPGKCPRKKDGGGHSWVKD